MMAKAHLVGTYGISGIAQWALGMEDPAQWKPLRDYAASLPHPGGTDAVGAVEVVVPVAGSQVIVGGWAFDPESDLPIQVSDHDGRRPVGRAGQRRPSRPGVRLPGHGSLPRVRLPGRGDEGPAVRLRRGHRHRQRRRPRRRSAARRSRSADRGPSAANRPQPGAAGRSAPTTRHFRRVRVTVRARAAGQSASAACTRAMEPSTSTGSNQTVSSPHSSAPRRFPRWSSTKTTVAGSGSPSAARAAW